MMTIGPELKNRKKSLIIPIFIMNSGCPHRCVFCNQEITAGRFPTKITEEHFNAQVNAYLKWNKTKAEKVEIAFYGGSFTGIDPDYQSRLLHMADSFIAEGVVDSIRVSTRPDYISEERLSFLKKYKVSTVEIGAESFVDKVLESSGRGHDADAIVNAMKLLKEKGFTTGLHLMAGLPKDTKEGFMYSVEKVIDLKPDMARIHPVIVFKETDLAKKYVAGEYRPLELSEAVELCSLAWEKLSREGIRVIRMGVHITPDMEQEGIILAGPVHPAFGSLVMSRIFYHYTLKGLMDLSGDPGELIFILSERDVSSFRGLHNENVEKIKKVYPFAKFNIISKPDQPSGAIKLKTDSGLSMNIQLPGFN